MALLAAQAMYSLSQDNFPFRRKMLNEPAALQVLARVVANESGSKAKAAPKGKGKADGANGNVDSEDSDSANLLRLLVCGMCPFNQ